MAEAQLRQTTFAPSCGSRPCADQARVQRRAPASVGLRITRKRRLVPLHRAVDMQIESFTSSGGMRTSLRGLYRVRSVVASPECTRTQRQNQNDRCAGHAEAKQRRCLRRSHSRRGVPRRRTFEAACRAPDPFPRPESPPAENHAEKEKLIAHDWPKPMPSPPGSTAATSPRSIHEPGQRELNSTRMRSY